MKESNRKQTQTNRSASRSRADNSERESAQVKGASRDQSRNTQDQDSDWREHFRGGYGNTGTMSRAGFNRGGVGAGYDESREPGDAGFGSDSDVESNDTEVMSRTPSEGRAAGTGRWAETGFGPRGYSGGFSNQNYSWRTRGEQNRETGPYSGRGPRGYQRSDERLFEEVCDLLTEHGDIDASDIEVRCESGEVILEGTVPDRQTKRLAEDIAESARGVHDVRNNLRIQAAGRGNQPSERQDSRDYGASTRGSTPSRAVQSGAATLRAEGGNVKATGRSTRSSGNGNSKRKGTSR